MLNKVNLDTNNLEISSAEELADLFFEIGGSQSKNNQWAEAVHWLESVSVSSSFMFYACVPSISFHAYSIIVPFM